VNNELERMRKDAIVATSEVLPLNLLGGTEKNHENVAE
jgi:hypothetical protein